ncbi:hypothetical protein PC129_g14477 [Phytophthora cactorum]|uniref:Uncharacterized protein n=1 Tax=Phytophthora cactorum TaxID=29920 RepID=A0A8T1EYN3_9STRA|nr:hypothetical protein Pcac1_g4942 [Phytophthora cactorum]KAG2810248.1 hypothetical protein PC112_g16131 [Phytophthora cactorum]KAG2811731.1 hypothetical protein PC111_g15114 [Phytophthora cactorum]KAG2889877.1 hypothetical protein PC114_g17736 [Phytophthora cactorum]KAG2964256.1 hypothetical protein PC118_g20429 [Phytophthora cactorum]
MQVVFQACGHCAACRCSTSADDEQTMCLRMARQRLVQGRMTRGCRREALSQRGEGVIPSANYQSCTS